MEKMILGLDAEALHRLACELAGRERGATADLLACLAEVERREVHLDRAFPNIFEYCVGALHYSEGAAGRRVSAMRAARKAPEALSYLRSGDISLSTLSRLEPHLSVDPAGRLIHARGLRRRELDEYLMKLASEKRAQDPEQQDQGKEEEPPALLPLPASDPPRSPAPQSRDVIAIASPGRVRISFEATTALESKLERVGCLLSHRLKSRRMEELVEALADIAIARLEPARSARRSASPGRRTRRVPAAVRGLVWTRDGGRCAYTAADGVRCEARRWLQYDHIRPWALGGRSDDAANIRLLCRAHNLRLARRTFGNRGPSATAR
jgi:hypothetical protein